MHQRKASTSTDPSASLWGDEAGSAALEFITVGVLLLVPLVYLILTLGTVQEQTLGAEAAARHAARVISQAKDAATAERAADAVVTNAIHEYGMDADDVAVRVSCHPAPNPCPAAGSTVTVTVRTRASLPFMPPLFGLDQIAAIPIEAQSTQKMSRLWGQE